MKERIITGLAMIAVIITIIFFIPALFTPLVAIILGIATWEWSRMCQLRQRNGYLMTGATIILWIIASFSPFALTTLLILAVIHYLYAIHHIREYERIDNYRVHRTYLRVCGPIVLAAMAASILYIFNNGKALQLSSDTATINDLITEDALSLTFVIMIIAAADTGAYFVGRFFGKNKLSPKASPKKTIEGLVGGIASVIIVVTFFDWMVEGWYFSYLQLLTISIVSALFSVVGDLFISIIKRQNNLKDSSNILPGHGGILDRIDGMLAGIPVFYLLQQYV